MNKTPKEDASFDPQDWEDFRSKGHKIFDDMVDDLAGLRQRTAWQPMNEAAVAPFKTPLPQKGAGLIIKTLKAAIANAQNNFDLNPQDLFLSEIYAGDGPRLKRITAGARGRYKPRVKRTSHLTVILAEREDE